MAQASNPIPFIKISLAYHGYSVDEEPTSGFTHPNQIDDPQEVEALIGGDYYRLRPSPAEDYLPWENIFVHSDYFEDISDEDDWLSEELVPHFAAHGVSEIAGFKAMAARRNKFTLDAAGFTTLLFMLFTALTVTP